MGKFVSASILAMVVTLMLFVEVGLSLLGAPYVEWFPPALPQVIVWVLLFVYVMIAARGSRFRPLVGVLVGTGLVPIVFLALSTYYMVQQPQPLCYLTAQASSEPGQHASAVTADLLQANASVHLDLLGNYTCEWDSAADLPDDARRGGTTFYGIKVGR